MAKTATTKATTTPVAAPVVATGKEPTKMERAAPIFKAVMEMTEEQRAGKTPRRIFMDRAIAELGMGAAGANTYFQNLKNEGNGEGRYKYAPASQAPTVAPQAGAENPVAAELHALRTSVTALNRTVNKLVKAAAVPAHA